MTTGKRVKEVRKNKRLTQQAFADVLGVTKAHISKIETENANPSESLMRTICFSFGISEKWLKTGEGQRDFSIVDQYAGLTPLQTDEMDKGLAARTKWGWISSTLLSQFDQQEQNAVMDCLQGKDADDFAPVMDHLIYLWYTGDAKLKARIEVRIADVLKEILAYSEARK